MHRGFISMRSESVMPVNFFVSVFGVILFLSFSHTAAFALTPTAAEPGTIIKNFEDKDRDRARLEDIITVPEMDQPASGASAQKVFELRGVVLDRTEAYQTENFVKIYEPYLGQKVSFADLNAIAAGMTRKYRNDGYIFSRVIVPPQKVGNGIVHFQAVEGRISSVQLVGNYQDKSGLIKSMADQIRDAGPANTQRIERYLLLINDLPGITARSFIKPSKTPGGGDLIISVEEDNFEGSVSLDSRGSRYLGPYRGELVGAFNNGLGLYDRTTFRVLGAAQLTELKYSEINHEEQLGHDGMRLNARLAMTASAPGGNISSLDIEGDSMLADVTLTYPVIRARQLNLNLMGGMTGLNSETDVAGIKTAADRVRYVHASGRLDFTDELRGVNQFDLQLAKGFGGLGATDDGTGRSRANGNHGFFRAGLTATRIQDLPLRDFSLFLSASGQASATPLLASEEFTLGGSDFGRAFDSGEIAGDTGYAGLVELRYDGPVNNEVVKSYQAYTFLDGGRVFNRAAVAGETGSDSLVSTGVGMRFNLVQNFSGYVEFDSPLTQIVKSENGKKSRLFFNLIKRF